MSIELPQDMQEQIIAELRKTYHPGLLGIILTEANIENIVLQELGIYDAIEKIKNTLVPKAHEFEKYHPIGDIYTTRPIHAFTKIVNQYKRFDQNKPYNIEDNFEAVIFVNQAYWKLNGKYNEGQELLQLDATAYFATHK